jgi:predicted protein tyrosine phosphatase
MNTVIHCRAGIGRTSVVATGVLLHAGFEVTEAFEKISEIRGVQVPDTQEQYDWVLAKKNEILSKKKGSLVICVTDIYNKNSKLSLIETLEGIITTTFYPIKLYI